MTLSLQDKLALAMTSAGSQRQLAALLGITHQKLGRWLREGEPGGVSRIPPEAASTINLAFDLHKQITREQARRDRLPYDPKAPVFINRPPLRDGSPGERVWAEQTQYMRQPLRDAFIAWAHQTKQFILVSIRSTINLYSYIKAKPTDTPEQLRARVRRPSLGDAFDRREDESPGSNRAAPLFTMYERMGPGADLRLVLQGVRQKLQQKHEPHTGPGNPGTVLADQILFQTYHGQHDQNTKPTPKRTGKAYRVSLKRR